MLGIATILELSYMYSFDSHTVELLSLNRSYRIWVYLGVLPGSVGNGIILR